jgi:two-component system CheB/CheR fusion protein
MPLKSQKRTDDPSLPSHYVGIGASAGGLEAIEAFFKHMPVESGMAFVVIQHLSPDYKSLMVELLSKRTPIMVQRAENGMQVQANHIYLIPPKKNLTIFHGRLLLNDQDYGHGINLPIDIFLRSLAEDLGKKSIAVILSGTGSDGMRGLQAIKEAGGLAMVQDEDSAKFDGMPRAAASTGLADFILPPSKMPKRLIAYAKHPYVSDTDRTELLLGDDDGLTRIFSLLRTKMKVDFAFYKSNTVVRRIERRMTINQTLNLKEYVQVIESNPSELTNLYRELLIGVTSFFRDPAAFHILRSTYLPELVTTKKGRDLRIWVAGCSTGEEAYSIAIILREVMEQMGKTMNVKIFATDIDHEAITQAGNGEYPESIAADVEAGLLAKYFFRKGDLYQIVRTIREMVVFAQHNLIKDPPFAHIDLVSCRNLLIYLQPVLQHKAMDMFNFSLAAGGLLFLGTSETIGEMMDYFAALHHKWKIYRCRGKRRQLNPPIITEQVLSTNDAQLINSVSARKGLRQQREEAQLLDRLLHSLSGDYLPLVLVVNDLMEVVHIVGDTGGLFKLPVGKMSNDIQKMAVKGLAIPLATGLQKVFKEQEPISFTQIRLRNNDDVLPVRMRIKPLLGKKNQPSLAVVFIEKGTVVAKNGFTEEVQAYDLDKEAQQRITDLENELQFSRENLQATIEELETSNEELQAANEELLASNEELQSTNEELQSVNEELYTVNAEFQSKIIELTELNNDMNNLMGNTRIATMFLDENLDIRKFTPGVEHVYKIIQSDLGRPLSHLAHRLKEPWDLGKIAEQVQNSKEPRELEVCTMEGRWFLMRVLPYFITPETTSGIVLTLIAIDNIKKAQLALKQEKEMVSKIIETSPSGITVVDSDGRIRFANPKADEILQLKREKRSGQAYKDPAVKDTDDRGNLFPGKSLPFNQVMETRQPCYGVEHAIENKAGQRVLLRVNAAPLIANNGKVTGVVSTIEDRTYGVRQKTRLVESEERYSTLLEQQHTLLKFIEAFPVEIILFSGAGKVLGFNQKAVNKLGVTDIVLRTTDAAMLFKPDLLAIVDRVRIKRRAVYFHKKSVSHALPYGVYPLNIKEEDATLIMIFGFTDREVKDYHDISIDREEGVAQII